MNTQRKAPATALAGLPGSGTAVLLSRILAEERGTGRVHGPQRGYVRCGREYPAGRPRTHQRGDENAPQVPSPWGTGDLDSGLRRNDGLRGERETDSGHSR